MASMDTWLTTEEIEEEDGYRSDESWDSEPAPPSDMSEDEDEDEHVLDMFNDPNEAPEVEAPEVEVPEVEAPEVEVPEVEAPEVEVPKFEAPEFEATPLPDLALEPAPVAPGFEDLTPKQLGFFEPVVPAEPIVPAEPETPPDLVAMTAELTALVNAEQSIIGLQQIIKASRELAAAAQKNMGTMRTIQKAAAPRQRAPRGSGKKTAAQFFNQANRAAVSELYKAGGRSARLSADAPKQNQIQAMLADKWKALVDRSPFINMAAAQ